MGGPADVEVLRERALVDKEPTIDSRAATACSTSG